MPIAEQAAQVNRVKRSENGMISDPVTLSKDHTLAEAKELMAKYKISGLPVVDKTITLLESLPIVTLNIRKILPQSGGNNDKRKPHHF
jgi:CBS domain-containing protein